ncbi:ATP-binding cassette domain-containing protein [Actinomadura sp. 1N219]|uniref:ABC transporter permease subunit n=1 Tax=Actinomadura sp. 1N219 TaxID=3375152 RepID=UPI003798009E
MSDLITTVVQSLGPGAMLAMFALGLVLIYRSTGVINLAHGAQASLGALLYWDAVVNWGIPSIVALAVAVLGSGLVGALIHVAVMHPLRDAAKLTQLIGSIGVMIVVQSALLLTYGSTTRTVPALLPSGTVGLPGGATVGADRLWLLLIGIGVTTALWATYRYTSFGVRTAAVAENAVSAAALGVSSTRVASANWFLGGCLAGLAGAMLAPVAGANIVTLNALLVPGLGAALFGGLLSFPLTLIGALVVQVVQAIASENIDVRGIAGIASFAIIVVLMLVRGSAIPERGFVGMRLPSLGSGRIGWWAVLWVGVSVAFVVNGDPEWVDAVLTSMIIAIVMLSAVVITGYAGQLSLAQFSLAGCGAYIAVQLSQRFDVPFPVLLLASAALTIPIGLLLSIAAMRMRGASLAVITVSFAVALYAAVFSQSQIQSVPSPSLAGWDLSPIIYPERYLALATAVFVIAAVLAANLRRGATGRRFVAVRGNERASAALGIRVGLVKATAFSIATFIAALGGVLYVFRSPSVEFGGFTFESSVEVLAWTVIGGLGFIAGPLLGMGFAPGGIGTQLVETIIGGQSSWLPLIGGIALLATVVLNQDGIASVLLDAARPVRRRLRRGPSSTPGHEMPSQPAQEPSASAAHSLEPETVTASKPSAKPARHCLPLEVRGVSVSFGGVHALTDVDLALEPGTVHGLIGPNGAGKSTLLDVISGFVSPRTGRITLGDQGLGPLKPWQRARIGIGRSFQSVELIPDLDVEDNIRVATESSAGPTLLRDLVLPSRRDLPPAAREIVRMLDLEGDLHRRVGELSFGRQRLAAIARALATDSQVILLDEPASGLDDTERRELTRAIRLVAHGRGIGVLLIEHDVDLVLGTSDVVTALDFGKVIASGSPEEVRASPEVIASYIGRGADDPNVQGEGAVAK